MTGAWLKAELAGEFDRLPCPPGVVGQGTAALAELEGGIDLPGSAVAVPPVLANLGQGQRGQRVVLYGGPHAELDKLGVIIPADGPQAAQVAMENDLLQARHLISGDEMVEDGVR